MTTQLEFALWYARSGMAVLPLHRPVRHERSYRCSCGRRDCTSPAKHPFGRLVQKGLQDASKDPDEIARWFGEGRLNIGIATGAVSGIIVLDIDPRHHGDGTLAALEQEHRPLPNTWRFLTGGGGEHILFQHPGTAIPNSAAKLGHGVDVRGDGGYIVAPPSEHISGRPYAISVDHHPDDVQLADMPAWLLEPASYGACSNQACSEAGHGLAQHGQRDDCGGRTQSNARQSLGPPAPQPDRPVGHPRPAAVLEPDPLLSAPRGDRSRRDGAKHRTP